MNEFSTWAKAAGVRALKTFAQAALSVISLGPATGILDVSWLGVASVAALASVVSLLTSVAGLPEVSAQDNSDNNALHRRNPV